MKPDSPPSAAFRHPYSYLPPTRKSDSHTGMDHPGGPSSQRFTSTGSVNALQTGANEEAKLESRLGEEYLAYKARTPRFVPALGQYSNVESYTVNVPLYGKLPIAG